MTDLNTYIKDELLSHGADIVGFGDLTKLSADVRDNLPVGISVAVKYPPDVIKGISVLPTQEYFDWYEKLNERLDMLVTLGAEALQALGYTAVAQTREHVGYGEDKDYTLLPHKTVATRAGLGWIGRSALFVTKEYGSMVRLSSILTNAPLKTAVPVNKSQCGMCRQCKLACPAGAIIGNKWEAGIERDKLLDAVKCRKAARERAKQGFGGGATICGKCIEVCPRTRNAWNTGI